MHSTPSCAEKATFHTPRPVKSSRGRSDQVEPHRFRHLATFGSNWELLLRIDQPAQEWLSLKLERPKTTTRKCNFWVGWNVKEQRFARNSDYHALMHRKPDLRREITNWLRKNGTEIHRELTQRQQRIAQIENALDALLRQAILEDARRAERHSELVSFAPRPLSEWLAANPDDLELDEFLSRPVGRACRDGVRLLGTHLFRLAGSTDAMRATLERVAERDPGNYGRRVAIMDKRWDGIGNDVDRWWA